MIAASSGSSKQQQQPCSRGAVANGGCTRIWVVRKLCGGRAWSVISVLAEPGVSVLESSDRPWLLFTVQVFVRCAGRLVFVWVRNADEEPLTCLIW